MNTKLCALFAILVSALGTTAAEASRKHVSRESSTDWFGNPLSGWNERPAHGAGGLGARPAQWCGWWMRTQRGGGPEYNLASSWRHYGSPSAPQVGAVVVWSHHVGEITGRAPNGQWLVRSGNDSGRVQTRARSLAGAVVRM